MAEDAVNIERPAELEAYLRRTRRIGAGERVGVEVLAGGVSNRTVRVERESGEAWVLKQALPKLRVAVDWFSDPARIRREAEGLRWLNEAVPGCTPLLLFEDPANHVLAMEAVPRPHRSWKELLLAHGARHKQRFDPDALVDQYVEFAEMLAAIHRCGHEQRKETAVRFADRSYFESLRVEPYYRYTASQVPEAAEFFAALVESTRLRRLTVVHGDYSPKNILVRGDTGTLVLLDHEVIHFGDPAFDLGFAMTHLLSKANYRSEDRVCDSLLAAADGVWFVYCTKMKGVPWIEDLEGHVIRHTLGCLLARVSGRSPLEYLSESQRQRQRDAVIRLMRMSPQRVRDLIDGFQDMAVSSG